MLLIPCSDIDEALKFPYTKYLCVSYVGAPSNKQQLCPYEAFTHQRLWWRIVVFPVRRERNFEII
jgi:hypothetical protein